MDNIVNVLVNRDGMSESDAHDMVKDFQDRLYDGEIEPFEAGDMFLDEFGFEEDYLLDLLY